MKQLLTILFGIILFLLFVAFLIKSVVALILYISPNLMQTLGLDNKEMALFALGLILIFIIAGVFILSSVHLGELIKIITKIVIGVVLLIITYSVYPEGILNTPLSMLTIGGIGRLVMSLLMGLALIVDVYCIIRNIP